MAYNILLNSSNVVTGSSNCQYKYNFPMGNIDIDDNTVLSINQITLPYSWYNITAAYGNNTFQYIIPTATGSVTRTITIPDGFYQLADINSVLWADMFSQGFFFYNVNPYNSTTNSNGYSNESILYPISFVSNTKNYSNAVSFQYIPNNPAACVAMLGSSWYWASTFPPASTTPQIIITGLVTNKSTLFGNVIGFTNGTYPQVPLSPLSLQNNAMNYQPVIVSGNSLSPSVVNNVSSAAIYSVETVAGSVSSSIVFNIASSSTSSGIQVGMYIAYPYSFTGLKVTAISGNQITVNGGGVTLSNNQTLYFINASSYFNFVTSGILSAAVNTSTSVPLTTANSSIIVGMVYGIPSVPVILSNYVTAISTSTTTTVTLYTATTLASGTQINFYYPSLVISTTTSSSTSNSYTIVLSAAVAGTSCANIIPNMYFASLNANDTVPAGTIVSSISTVSNTTTITLSNKCSISASQNVLFYNFISSSTSLTTSAANFPFAPNATQVNTVVVRCNLVDNPIGIPTDLLDSFPINNTFGSNINYLPISDNATKMKKGKHSSLIVTLQDQNFNNINIQDPNVSISLVIKKQ